MNLEKANLKIMVANNLGADIEDRVDGEMRAAHELNGASQALRQAAAKVPRDLSAKVDAALREGEIPEGLSALDIAGLVKKYLSKAGDFLNHLADVEAQKSSQQFGRVEGLRQAMQIVLKTKEIEAKKIQIFTETQDSQESDSKETENRTAGSQARRERGSAADRKSSKSHAAALAAQAPSTDADPRVAEQAAREERGSVADRRAAAQADRETERPRKKKTAKKTAKPKLRAVKRAAPE